MQQLFSFHSGLYLPTWPMFALVCGLVINCVTTDYRLVNMLTWLTTGPCFNTSCRHEAGGLWQLVSAISWQNYESEQFHLPVHVPLGCGRKPNYVGIHQYGMVIRCFLYVQKWSDTFCAVSMMQWQLDTCLLR